MVLGRYLEDNLIKASHIYKHRWPVTYAVCPKYSLRCYALFWWGSCRDFILHMIVEEDLHLDAGSAANMFSAQKEIESAFDRFKLIVVPESLTDFKVSCEQPKL